MFKVSVSKVKLFLRCRLAYYYRYVEKLVPKRKPVTLERGSIIHACLETHYKGGDWKATLALWQADVEHQVAPFMSDKEKLEWATLPSEVYRIVNGYLRAFRQHDEQFTIRGIEHTGFAVLPSGITLEYRLDKDLTEKETGLNFVSDTKTVKDIPDDSVRFTDVQTAIYLWAHEQTTGEPYAGILWDYVRTKAPTVPRLLGRGGLSRDKSIDTDWTTYRATLLSNGLDPKDYEDMKTVLADKAFYKRIKQARPEALVSNIVREVDYTARQMLKLQEALDAGTKVVFQRTLLNDCAWSCPFRDLCFAELAGQPVGWIRHERFEVRDGADPVDAGSVEESDSPS